MGYRRVANALLVAALLVYAVDAALEQVSASVDLWWHLAAGRYIVEHLAVPGHDPFSYTHQGARWFNPEWLSQVLLLGLFRSGGGTALALFKLIVVLAVLGLAVRLAWRRSGSLLLSVAPALAAALLCRPFLDVRSDLFLYLGTLLVIAIIDAYRRGGSPALVILLPVTIALWVNLHGSFLYGLGVIGLYAGAELAKAGLGLPDAPLTMARARRLALGAVAAGLACLLHPEPIGALTFPFAILAPDAAPWRQVTEWLPSVLFQNQAFNPALFGYFLLAEILLALAVLCAAPRRLDLSDSLLVTVTAVMALRGRRFIPLLALVSVPFLARNLAVLRARLLPRPAGAPELQRPRGAIAVGVLSVAAVALLLTVAAPRLRQKYADGFFEGMIDGSFFPHSAVEFLRSNPAPARLFHLYAWGGYLAFQLPARQVFIDGRAHTVYPGEFYRDETRAELGYPGWDAFLDRYGVELVLWQTSGAAEAGREGLLRRLLESPAWERIYDDGYAAVFAHRARAHVWIEQYRTFRLAYPDVSRAQFFLATAYLDGLAFEPARQKLRDVVQRFPDGAALLLQAEQWLAAAGRPDKLPLVLFSIAFYRDARSDGPGAIEAYRGALARGLADPHAAWARTALERLGGQAG